MGIALAAWLKLSRELYDGCFSSHGNTRCDSQSLDWLSTVQSLILLTNRDITYSVVGLDPSHFVSSCSRSVQDENWDDSILFSNIFIALADSEIPGLDCSKPRDFGIKNLVNS